MTSFFESLYHFVGCAIPVPFVIARIAVPFLFQPWTQKRPMPLQESHRVIPAFFGIRKTILIIRFPGP